ncbi:MAG: hypothetical protein U0414_18240 [Polyangiaceae bacterium]
MRDATPWILLSSAALFAAGCSSPRAEYERAVKTLQPTFEALTKLRAETLLDPKIPDGGDLGGTIKEQVERCAGLRSKTDALVANTAGYTDKPLIGMIAAIERDLRDGTTADKCAAPEKEEDDVLARMSRFNQCVESCRAWFVNVERDAGFFAAAARAAGLDAKGIPPDARFSE